MKKFKFTRFFSSVLALVMVLSLLSPFSAFANGQTSVPFKKEQDASTLEAKAAVAEQLNLASGGAKLHEELQKVSGNEQISVIVHLSEKPVALEKGIKELAGKTLSSAEAKKVKAKVDAQQVLVTKAMTNKNISFEKRIYV